MHKSCQFSKDFFAKSYRPEKKISLRGSSLIAASPPFITALGLPRRGAALDARSEKLKFQPWKGTGRGGAQCRAMSCGPEFEPQ